jgi:hypothetical protein
LQHRVRQLKSDDPNPAAQAAHAVQDREQLSHRVIEQSDRVDNGCVKAIRAGRPKRFHLTDNFSANEFWKKTLWRLDGLLDRDQ